MVGKIVILNCADVSMLGYGCGVSQYFSVFVEDLDMYQVLPHPYLGYLDGFPGDNLIKIKLVLDLASESEFFSGNVLNRG